MSEPRVVRRRVIVSGQVQGVFFRDSTRREAERRNVRGWVRNWADGRVEAVFEGEQSAVEALVELCATGTPEAVVEHVETRIEQPDGIVGFQIR